MPFLGPRVTPYVPPAFAQNLPHVPPHYIPLKMGPTPIQPWRSPHLPPGFTLYIKRDDLTGYGLGGNKVRKLEFLLADAMARDCDTVITCGGLQSNHARATALAARQCGLDSYLVLYSRRPTEDPGVAGNLLLDLMAGAKLRLVDELGWLERDAVMEECAAQLRREGRRPYIIPVGGSNVLGLWGCLELVRELMGQADEDRDLPVDDVVLAIGSSGTAGGVAIGVHLAGLPIKVHAVCVCNDSSYFYAEIQSHLNALGLQLLAQDIIDIIDGYQGIGYARSTDAELKTIVECAQATGIVLDPVYTGKAYCGLVQELAAHPQRFRGRRILFLHTGGAFGLWDKLPQLAPILAADGAVQPARR